MIVTIMSVLLIVFGIILIGVSVAYQTKHSALTADMGELTPLIDYFRNVSFLVCLIAAIITLILGAFGSCCMLDRCKNRCLACLYGVMLFGVWIAFLVIGAVIIYVVNFGEKAANDICFGSGGDFKEL